MSSRSLFHYEMSLNGGVVPLGNESEAGRRFGPDGRMNTIMKLNALTSLAQVAAFLAGTQPVTFSVLNTKDEGYQWIPAN